MYTLCCGSRQLTLDRPRVMGVLNITPDSFSDGGELYQHGRPDLSRILNQARCMQAQGAAILDIGGESTRPGADTVGVKEEMRRVIPVVESLLPLDIILSVDTRHPQVAAAALEAGAHMINDVSALMAPGMLETVAASDAAICLMHMQGNPRTMQAQPIYQDVVEEVRDFLHQRLMACREGGIQPERIILDPGFGFGKTLAHNLKLLKDLTQCRIEGYPLLVGLSRKSMIGALTGRARAQDRLGGSLSAAVIAALKGANVIRTHEVEATVDALAVATHVLQQPQVLAQQECVET